MDTVIRIKDLFIVIWEKRIKVGIVALSIFLVAIAALFMLSSQSKTVQADVQLAWSGKKYEYPNKTTLVKNDLVAKPVLEAAKVISGVNADVEKIYKNSLINVTELSTATSNTNRQYSLSLNVRKSGLSTENAEKYINSLVKAFQNVVVSQVLSSENPLGEFSVNNDVITNYYKINAALVEVYDEVEKIEKSSGTFTYEGKSMTVFLRQVMTLMNENKVIQDKIFISNGSNNYTVKTSETDITKYITKVEALVSFENAKIKALEEEEVRLKDLIGLSEKTDVTDILDRILEIDHQLKKLKQTVKPINDIISVCTNVSNNCSVNNDVTAIKTDINSLYTKTLNEEVVTRNVIKAYYETVVRVSFINYNEVVVKSMFSTMFMILALIGSVGISVVAFWIMEDWDIRYKKRKKQYKEV